MQQIRLYILMEHEDDPRKCTAARLTKFEEARSVRDRSRIPGGSIVLDPEAEKSISREDRDVVMKLGLLAVDCSWNQLTKFPFVRAGLRHRALPFVLAANPTNFGKAQKLTTAEALAAAIYILGFPEQAERVMSRFKWGPVFIEVNREILDAYASVETSAEVCAIQNDIVGRAP
ncbi:MAG: DUF367 family protein [Thermoplasmata archaeon]|nr:DUF367 family protein [Thermoplasmata archaeon]